MNRASRRIRIRSRGHRHHGDESPRGATLVFALGANLGDALGALRLAARALACELEEARVSSVVSTPPEGGADQPRYLNAVVAGVGAHTPDEALALARRLEGALGRERPYPGAPRTLDVDVVFMGGTVIHTPDLRIPHPRWRTRDFVVVPLLDVVPGFVDPESGLTVADVARDAGWAPGRFPVVAAPGDLLRGEAA